MASADTQSFQKICDLFRLKRLLARDGEQLRPDSIILAMMRAAG